MLSESLYRVDLLYWKIVNLSKDKNYEFTMPPEFIPEFTMPPEFIPEFTMPPEFLYSGKTVHIIGIIQEYKGSPEIIVKTPDQIKILD